MYSVYRCSIFVVMQVRTTMQSHLSAACKPTNLWHFHIHDLNNHILLNASQELHSAGLWQVVPQQWNHMLQREEGQGQSTRGREGRVERNV